ncbi:MAG: TIGR03862 family flavoprotein [Alphaproteobacteria bacterium]|nr:TIGR03862 family flavoprotein [Alphaproteobacteria bacterium]
MKSSSPRPLVAIIGCGPAGLMAAERLSAVADVTLYDRMPSAGRKFLMAGRGGLNLTHGEAFEPFLARYGAAAAWLRPAIAAFPPEALRAWCEGLGQKTFVGSSKRVFPESLKASPLLRAWLRRLDAAGVTFALRHEWRGWDKDGALLFDAGGEARAVKADAVVLALGGASWPKLGSDGGWVDLLRGQGIEVATLRPANCGFVAPWSTMFGERFAGQPLKPLKAVFAGVEVQEEAMITRTSLEGGLIYALSSALREAVDKNGEAVVTFDLKPGLTVAELGQRLRAPRGSQSLSTFLRKAAGLTPASIVLMRESAAGAALPEAPDALAAWIKAVRIRLTATAPIDRAISSAGGIMQGEIDADFMLRKKPGMFVAGEMLDWEAPTGGYLLQASFSTAVMAAEGVRKYLDI